jgi:hypothetical protein
MLILENLYNCYQGAHRLGIAYAKRFANPLLPKKPLSTCLST